MERMPPEYEARLRLKDPTLAFINSEGNGIELVEVLDPVVWPTSPDPYNCWYDFGVRVRSLNVHVPGDMVGLYLRTPWIEPEYAIWVEDDQ